MAHRGRRSVGLLSRSHFTCCVFSVI